MATSQNGWPLVEDSDCAPLTVAGVPIMRGVLKGDVWLILKWAAEQFHARVEPLRHPGCWGYNNRVIGGTKTWSNHASGTAMDLNAPQHNMGDDPTPGPGGGYTKAQVAEIHQIEAESGGALVWGGDFVRNPDGMHFEIGRNKAAVARFADKLREGEVTPAEIAAIAEKVWGSKWGEDPETAGVKLDQTDARVQEHGARLDVIERKLDGLILALNNLPATLTPPLVEAVGDAAEGASMEEVKDIVTEALGNTRLSVDG